MVWYNITAYNVKAKFVLRNNKEKVICNNKNAEGEMHMKCKRNLERAIVLGLILSTGVYGSAWAADIYYHGEADENGDSGAVIPISGDDVFEVDNVDIQMSTIVSNKRDDLDTSAALIFDGAQKQKNYVITGNVKIINTIDTPTDANLKMSNNDGLQVINGSKVDIKGNDVYIASVGGSGYKSASFQGMKLTARKKSTALSVGIGNNNEISIIGDNVKIIGNIDFTSDDTSALENIKNNKVILELNSQNSYFYGDVYDRVMAEGLFFNGLCGNRQGTAELTLLNGAEWIYDEIPQIENLKLNGGVVVLDDDYIQSKYDNEIIYVYDKDGKVVDSVKLSDDRQANHKIVKIDKLRGSGIFKANLDWEQNKGDKHSYNEYYYDIEYKGYNIHMARLFAPDDDYIFITDSEENTTQVIDFDTEKANLDKMNVGDRLYFANVADGDTSFITASSVYSNAGNVFDYTYGTGSEDEDNDGSEDWYIAVSGKSAESNPNFSAAKGAMYAGYALGTELDTLNKRMGEARYLEEDDGVWVRYRHSKTGWDDTYETNGDMFQLGFDNEVTEKDGKHYRGVAIDYTDADTNIMGISGEGEHERYAVSLYDTWLGEKGHYRDLVLRGGRINSDYDVSGAFSSGYEDIGGDYHQWFGSISAEWGRKNDMGTGWYFEPQVQAQLARIGGASYVSDSGVDVDQDGATSLIGRAGFRIGREYVKDNGKHDNFYIKADLLHEFAGDKSFSLDGNDGRYDKEYDGQETWCDVGIGADISLGKNSYFWADVERTFGADYDNTWQINGGFRWEF